MNPTSNRMRFDLEIIASWIEPGSRVIDLGSTNGTFVDGERVHAGALADGSTITVGRTRITGLIDKGAGRGALLLSEKELRDAVNLVSGAVKDLGDTLDDLPRK